jgi:hypothetical protein
LTKLALAARASDVETAIAALTLASFEESLNQYESRRSTDEVSTRVSFVSRWWQATLLLSRCIPPDGLFHGTQARV